MAESRPSTTISVRFADVTFQTIMDVGFWGLFGMTPNMHTHPYYEIQAVIAGAYSIEFPNHHAATDNVVRMEGDTLCLIPPSFYHCSRAISEKPQKLALRFVCEPTDNGEILTPLYGSFQAALSSITTPCVLHSAELCRLMMQIHQELASPQLGAVAMAQLYIGQFYIELLRLLHFTNLKKTYTKWSTGNAYDSRYDKIELYFAKHYSEPITEDDLAAELGLSKRQTSRVLQQIYGMSFREKRVSIRMNNAADLLIRTDVSIDQVARMVGYETTAGFLDTFKKFFGIPCVEYRKCYEKDNTVT